MKRKIVVTGIIKYKDEFLVVKRSDNEEYFKGEWEFPGGKLEDNEMIVDGLKRELLEEISFDIKNREVKIINYYDELKNGLHYVELDFLIEVENNDFKVELSEEHVDYCWIKKDSNLIDEFIRRKIEKL